MRPSHSEQAQQTNPRFTYSLFFLSVYKPSSLNLISPRLSNHQERDLATSSSCCGSVLLPTKNRFRSSNPIYQRTHHMARSLSHSKRLAALVADSLFFSLSRRGYAAASEVSVSVSTRPMVGKLEGSSVSKAGSEASSAWAPDPVTGYYRPINHEPEIDPVELRQMLLNHKVRSSH